MATKKPTSQHGGARERAGRPVGRRSTSTIKREAALKAALKEMLGELTPAQIRTIEPLSVLLWTMRASLAQGDLTTAAAIARQAADFCHSKMPVNTPSMPLPEDLEPDPVPEPDEEGPERLIE
jgi:hypothetical protein